ncbi:hypothetical protein [Halostella sp. PRR32]|uniref:hypothetical protein n=1 Tax=Halostella sp. PRR32 TaxID=3098147 RepID=UPI002B1D5399|nr:hypothetical protein [Halostella sp. PRR32]
MAASDIELDEKTMMSLRMTERRKREIGMRAEQLGMNKTQYLLHLVENDLSEVELPELE